MKYILKPATAFVVLLLTCLPVHSQTSRIGEYVAFLEMPKQSPGEYIISLFEDHDLVVLSERLHADVTQYEFILDMMARPGFYEQVGTIYFEIGGAHLTPMVDSFLLSTGLTEEEIEQEVLNIKRVAHWRPFWNAQTFQILLTGLYNINQTLTPENKLRLVMCDYPLDWAEVLDAEHPDIRKINHDMVLFNHEREITMSRTIIEDFDAVLKTSSRKKGLAILNTVHAIKAPEGISTAWSWATMYLQRHYGDRLANVYINMANPGVDDENVAEDLMDRGQWDAAFALTGNKPVGFNFARSPFGETIMYEDPDVPELSRSPIRDIFTGMVFYLPLEQHELVYGYKNNITDDFTEEFIRRSEIWGWPTDAQELKAAFNTETRMGYPDREEYLWIINSLIEEYSEENRDKECL